MNAKVIELQKKAAIFYCMARMHRMQGDIGTVFADSAAQLALMARLYMGMTE